MASCCSPSALKVKAPDSRPGERPGTLGGEREANAAAGLPQTGRQTEAGRDFKGQRECYGICLPTSVPPLKPHPPRHDHVRVKATCEKVMAIQCHGSATRGHASCSSSAVLTGGGCCPLQIHRPPHGDGKKTRK